MRKYSIILSFAMLPSSLLFAQWYPDIRLPLSNYAKKLPQNTETRCLVASDNTLHVVWIDRRHASEGNSSNSEIYYGRSSDGGTTWNADTRISNNPDYSGDPCLTAAGSLVHVVWANRIEPQDGYEIKYKRSTDSGITWEAETRLTNDAFDSEYPVIAASGQYVHMVWLDNRDGVGSMLYYKRSTDGGITWEADTRLTYELSSKQFPSIAASGQNVYVLWTDFRDGSGKLQVYFKRSTDGGLTWESDTRMTDNIRNQRYGTITAEGSTVHIAWEKNVIGQSEDICYRHSIDGGATWSAEMDLTNNISGEMKPNIAVSGLQVHLVWNDFRDGQEIYAKSSGDGGLTWGPEFRLSHKPQNWMYSQFPFVAASGTNAYVVWMDDRLGLTDLFYSQNGAPLCNMTVSTGADKHLYFGYGPDQCKTITVVLTDGTGPFIYNWTLDRLLLPGESLTGINTSTVTACLMDTAELCVQVIDANNCTAQDCATMFAEDVRCFSGNNQKIRICHNNTNICIDESAVPSHLAHGDYVGSCYTVSNPGGIGSENNIEPRFNVFPNPSKGDFRITLDPGNEEKIIRIIDITGRIVKELTARQSLVIHMDAPGTYFVQLITSKDIMTKKLVVVR